MIPRTHFNETVEKRAAEFARLNLKQSNLKGILLNPLNRKIHGDEIKYGYLEVSCNRKLRCVHLTLHGPDTPVPKSLDKIHQLGDSFWPLAMSRELDDAVLHLTFNEPDLGT